MRAASEIISLLGGASRPPMPLWQAAVAGVVAGTGRATVAVIGDSNTMGLAAGAANVASRAAAYSAVLADALDAKYGATKNAIAGFAGFSTNVMASYTSYNPNVVFSGTWTKGVASLGDGVFLNSVTDNFAFTPGIVWDTAVMFFAIGGTSTNFTADIGGTTTPLTVLANGYRKLTYTPGTRANQTLNLKRVSGSNLNVSMVVCYDSTAPKIDVFNLGWSGSTSTDWAGSTASTFDPRNALPILAPNLTIIALGGTNDINNSVGNVVTPVIPLATYKTNVQNLINAAKTTGDVALISLFPGTPSGDPIRPQADQDNFFQAAIDLAHTNNLRVLNSRNLLTDYTQMVANGYLAVDGVHLTGACHTVVGNALASLIG